jgi:hypothetical protein
VEAVAVAVVLAVVVVALAVVVGDALVVAAAAGVALVVVAAVGVAEAVAAVVVEDLLAFVEAAHYYLEFGEQIDLGVIEGLVAWEAREQELVSLEIVGNF